MKCFKVCCITAIILIVLIVGGTIAASLILTPAKVGLADLEVVGGQTLEDLGLADESFFNVIKSVINLLKGVDEKDVVKNAPSEEDKASAEQKLGTSTVEDLFSGNVSNVELKDTEFAALTNKFIANIGQSSSGEGGEGGEEKSEFQSMMETVSDIGLTPEVKEITVTQNDDGSAEVSTVVGLNLDSLKENMGGDVPEELAGVMDMLPENLFISLSAPVKVEDGEVVAAEGTPKFELAGVSEGINNALLNMLAGGGEGGEGGEGGDFDVNEIVSGLMTGLLNSAGVSGFSAGGLNIG